MQARLYSNLGIYTNGRYVWGELQSDSSAKSQRENAHYAIDMLSYTARFTARAQIAPSCLTHLQMTQPLSQRYRLPTDPWIRRQGDLPNNLMDPLCLQEHFPGVFNVLFDLDQEGHSLSAVE
jgi:hypothetical protein